MPKPTGPTDPNVQNLIIKLKKTKKKVWMKIAEQLLKSRKARPEVNLSKINRYTKEGSIVAVPGKVLS